MYCKGCKYDLRRSARQGRCPECGGAFDPRNSETYLFHVSRRMIWLDRASLLVQSLALGWLAAFVVLGWRFLTGSNIVLLPAVVATVLFGLFLGILILPGWWCCRPYWRMCWFWFRSPPAVRKR